MIINEFLPNPVGKDADGEWVELFNESPKTVALTGWQLKDASGKTFIFKSQTINAGEYLVFDYKTTKISLNNSDETLFLYDEKGTLVNKAEFSGAAPEGRSFARQGGQFKLTSQPTPGEVNIFDVPTSSITKTEIIPNNSATIINTPINTTTLLIGFLIALTLAFLSVFILKKIDYENL